MGNVEFCCSVFNGLSLHHIENTNSGTPRNLGHVQVAYFARIKECEGITSVHLFLRLHVLPPNLVFGFILYFKFWVSKKVASEIQPPFLKNENNLPLYLFISRNLMTCTHHQILFG
jgi:hypothetical protein